LVSIAVNFILIPNLGLTGAAFGLVTGTLVKYIITYLIFRNLKE